MSNQNSLQDDWGSLMSAIVDVPAPELQEAAAVAFAHESAERAVAMAARSGAPRLENEEEDVEWRGMSVCWTLLI